MSKAIFLSSLLVVIVNSATINPDSCFWCVSIGQTWDNINNKCAPTGYPLSKAEQCTLNHEFSGINMTGLTKHSPEAHFKVPLSSRKTTMKRKEM